MPWFLSGQCKAVDAWLLLFFQLCSGCLLFLMVIQGICALRQEQCGILDQVRSIPAVVTQSPVFLWAAVTAGALWISHLTAVSSKDTDHLRDPGLPHFYVVNRTKRSWKKKN